MAINPSNGVLDIINGTLKVSSIDVKQAGGFSTVINTVARNNVLLFDDQKSTTSFMPTAAGGYKSSTGVTRNTSSGSRYLELGTASDAGWVYWPLQLPNSWHAEFDMHVTATGGVLTFSLYNTSEPNHTDYTNNDGGYKIVFDNTNNQIVIYWEGSVHKTVSIDLRSNDWQHVNVNYSQGATSVSLAGKVVLTHEFTENYQEFNSRYVGFSATAGTSHKIRHLRIHNGDKWLYTKTSNASDITYVSGNVGIGSLAPTELLDVHGNVHIAKDLTVDGNLRVSGTTTFIDTTNTSIEDPIIELAKGNTSDTIDAGLIMTRNTSNVAIAYRGDEDELAFGYTQSGASGTDVTPIANGGLDVRVYGNLFANNLTTTANVEAAYLKGDGSYLTGLVTDLQSVADNGNTCSNTIQLTNTDVGLKATGNVEANYFVGDGSKLTGLVTDLQSVADNGNTCSNTIQFTNATTAFIANSNVGIGTSSPSADLHVAGYQYVNGPPTLTNSFDHSDAPLTLTHGTATSSTAINDPKPVLHLTRSGTNNESYGARASFNLSRYENSSTHSRSRLDVTLTDGTYAESTVMTLRADGKVGVGTTSPAYTLDVGGNINIASGYNLKIGGANAVFSNWTVNGSDIYRPSGNVGIGTASPSAHLHISSGTSGDCVLKLEADTDNDTETDNARIEFISDGGFNTALVGAGQMPFSSDNDNALVLGAYQTIFYTGVQDFTDSTNMLERMRIAHTGNVGIGTNNPLSTLEVGDGTSSTSGDAPGSISVSGTGATKSNGGKPGMYHRANIGLGLWSDAHMSFEVNGYQGNQTEAMRVTTAGNVGIGLTSPAFTLDVNGVSRSRGVVVNSSFNNNTARPALSSGSTHPSYEIRSLGGNGNVGSTGADDGFLRLRAGGGTSTANVSYIDLSGYSTYSGGDMKRNIVFGTFGTERMRIKENGNVGIGTANPQDKLHVSNGHIRIDLDKALTLTSTDTFTYDGGTMPHYGLLWRGHTAYTGSRTMQIAGHGGVRMFTAGAERLTILNNGNVGINDSTPSYKLSVNGSFRVHGSVATFGSDGLLHINSRSTTHGSETVALQTVIDGRALTDANPGTYGGESRNVLALQPDGGYVGIGTTSPNENLEIYGTGMRIHDPSSSPKLDFVRGGTSRSPNTSTFGQSNYSDWRITANGPSLYFQNQYTGANSGNLLTAMTIAHNSGNVGIGTTSPLAKLDIGSGGLCIHQGGGSINWYNGAVNMNANGYKGLMFTVNGDNLNGGGSSKYWMIGRVPYNTNLHFSGGGRYSCYMRSNTTNTSLNFTGQHRTFIKDVPFTEASGFEGLIVSASQNKYIKMNGGIEAGSNAITTNESLPVVTISNTSRDKKCFGVISASEDPETREDDYGNLVSVVMKESGDTRVYINSVGEGAIWVTNINGNLESGDYITTSNVTGYGMKQDSEFLVNYTVAKITMDCDFNPVTQPIQIILKELSNVNYWVKTTVSNVSLEEYSNLAEDVRTTTTEIYYSKEDGEITTDKYNTLESNVQSTYTELTRTIHQKISTEESKTEQEGSTLEVRQELMNVLDEHGQLQWEDDPSGATEKAYKIRYLDTDGNITDEANAVHIAAFVGCTYHCG